MSKVNFENCFSSKNRLYERFNTFCNEHGIPVIKSREGFDQRIQKMLKLWYPARVIDGKKVIDGKLENVWFGIKEKELYLKNGYPSKKIQELETQVDGQSTSFWYLLGAVDNELKAVKYF